MDLSRNRVDRFICMIKIDLLSLIPIKKCWESSLLM